MSTPDTGLGRTAAAPRLEAAGQSGEPRRGRLAEDLAAALLNRIDAWGVAFVVSLLAFLIHDEINGSTILITAAITAGYWVAFVINDYFDAPFDARDAVKVRLNFFVRHRVPKTVVAAGYLAVNGLVLLAFARFGLRGIALWLAFPLIPWAYSAPPLRLKSRPGLDLLTHAVFVQSYPYLTCLLLIDADWSPVDLAMLAINFLASLSGQLDQQVRDFEVDSATEGNFATSVGVEKTALYLKIVTATLVAVAVAAFAARILPLKLAPLALTFVPATIRRLRGSENALPARMVAAATTTAILYTILLFAHHLLAW